MHGLAIADSSHERLCWPEYFSYCLVDLGSYFPERTAINGKRQASDLTIRFLTPPEALRAEQRTRDPSERTFKAREKSASAKGKLIGEDVTPAKAAGKELYEERTQEWWEGYDPGMDAGF